MKKIVTLFFLFFFATYSIGQVSENFDGSFCSGITSCWKRATSVLLSNPRTSNTVAATSICTAATKNTTTPISGTGSLKGEAHYANSSTGITMSDFQDTIFSTAKGINGNTVSFKIRFSQLAFNTANLALSVNIVCSTYTYTQNFTPANQGTTFTFNETIAGSGAGGPIMIIISTSGFTFDDFDMVYDIDDFTTTGLYDTNNPCVVTILPVKLISFTAIANNCASVISWKTSEEINADKFIVESGTDGLIFNAINNSVISASGNPQTEKEYNLSVMQINNIAYYRLKILDKDGSYTYSDVRRVVTKCNGTSNVKLYPNPIDKNARSVAIDITTNLRGKATILLTNTVGQVLTKTEVEIISLSNVYSLEVGRLMAGTYSVRIMDSKGDNIGLPIIIVKN